MRPIVRTLKEERTDIEAVMSRLDGSLLDDKPSRELVHVLRNILQSHISKIDKDFYPAVERLANSDMVLNDAWDVVGFQTRKKLSETLDLTDRILRNPPTADAARELEHLCDALKHQFDQERKTLFPLYETAQEASNLDNATGGADINEHADIFMEYKEPGSIGSSGLAASNILAQLEYETVLFCYSGFMDEDILLSSSEVLKKTLLLLNVPKDTRRTLFYIFVELAQNILRYSANTLSNTEDEEKPFRHGSLVVGMSGNDYFVASVNRIHSTAVPRLRENLSAIALLSPKVLRQIYKDTLKSGPPEGSKGAGVGFIEMARRTNGGLQFSFIEDDAANTAFQLITTISQD